MNGYLLPDDKDWQADKALMTELTPVIAQLSKYVMRYFDADAGRAEAISVEDERALAEKVTALGTALQARVDRREALGEQLLTVEERRNSGHQTTTDSRPTMSLEAPAMGRHR